MHDVFGFSWGEIASILGILTVVYSIIRRLQKITSGAIEASENYKLITEKMEQDRLNSNISISDIRITLAENEVRLKNLERVVRIKDEN